MNQSNIPKKIVIKNSTDEIINKGDCCVIENLYYNNDSVSPHPAIILRCPFCRMDMASAKMHRIQKHGSWLSRFFGIKDRISVTPMLICPYSPVHKFYIRKNKIKAIKN